MVVKCLVLLVVSWESVFYSGMQRGTLFNSEVSTASTQTLLAILILVTLEI